MKNAEALISEIKELKKRIACYRFVMNKIVTGVSIVDENFIIIEYNKAYSELENILEDDAIGQTSTELYFATIKKQKVESRYAITMRTKKPIIGDYTRYLTHDGNYVHAVQNYYPIFYENELIGSCCLCNKVENLESEIDTIQKIQNEAIIEGCEHYDENDNKIVGVSDKIKKTLNEGLQVAISNVDALVIGETGTGKELMVRLIHDHSIRKESPFIPINCATIPENLLESILFGTKKGAFTDSQNTTGLFELAKDGTIFLDELNSMNLACQSKLLRAIQEKKIRKVGGENEIEINCRIIGAINKNPWEAIENGTLREDLFYRLSVACISMPSLRERMEDLKPLIEYFILQNNKKYKKQITNISDALYNIFYSYPWNGNVRELKNLLESMFILCDNEKTLSEKHISQIYLEKLTSVIEDDMSEKFGKSFENYKVTKIENSDVILDIADKISLKKAMDNYEKYLFNQASKRCSSTYEMAKILSVDQSTVVRKLQKHNITIK